jgi:hypothetical protein
MRPLEIILYTAFISHIECRIVGGFGVSGTLFYVPNLNHCVFYAHEADINTSLMYTWSDSHIFAVS